ncbi:uncharacterized protein LOC116425237 [Nomia melanderi]|uniref:uncharacterized protein LOC116425237 n=1 Tax=Nomia melanderi TaxID=2448451 RepID=UPI00130449EA|nr:zinc finger protein SNAI2-like [Nomia melanderi]
MKMRVKTMPRQRIYHGNNNFESVSEIIIRKSDKSSNNDVKPRLRGAEKMFDASSKEENNNSKEKRSDHSDVNEEKKKETLNCTAEALDMTIKHKVNSSQENLSNRRSIVGAPSSEYSDVSSKKDLTETIYSDSNNNVKCDKLVLSPIESRCCPLAGPSTVVRSPRCEGESKSSVQDDDIPAEAVNLCKKDHQDEDVSNPSGEADGKLKDTFLYKIMTDPTFLENIQKHKQPRKYSCQFCKLEFVNGDELADHMDVKKDESNQVVCCACKKTFAQKRYLRYHQRCHSERTKFTCDICTKKYTRLDNLTRHNAFHVNPDKFSCTYCEKTFARKDLLNKHLKCHDNKYRFFCELCQKYFKGPLTLDNHKKMFHSV